MTEETDMTRLADEIDALVADNPSMAELTEMHEVLLVMLHGISRGPDGSWQVDEGVAPLLGDIDPATAMKRIKRALAVVEGVLAQRDERG
jgi:hypothetical protein